MLFYIDDLKLLLMTEIRKYIDYLDRHKVNL